MIDYADLVKYHKPQMKEVKPLTVGQLRKALAKLPDDYEVMAYEHGSVYDTKVKALSVHPKDKEAGIKRVRIIHGN